MTANNRNFFSIQNSMGDNAQRGASILEILLAMGIVAVLSPFIYGQIAKTTTQIRDIAAARRIIDTRDAALNFVRLNQDKWPAFAQIKLDDHELEQITPAAHSGFIDKYQIKGASVTEVYLAFGLGKSVLDAANIAQHIGADAAAVTPDGVAFGPSWAVSAPDFQPGNLVYRISYDFGNDDISKYLHRGTSGEDGLNVMMRNLNMGNFNIYNIGTISVETGKAENSNAAFAEAANTATTSLYFAGGANMDGAGVKMGSVRVSGDITGFRTMTAKRLNREGFSTNGAIITDRAKINNAVNVGKNMTLKSDTTRTISGFSGIVTHSLATPFLSADEMVFGNNFGLTISGELLMSNTAPLRIGNWSFPTGAMPRFSNFELSRAHIPPTPDSSEFDKIIQSGWRERVGQIK